MKAIISTTREIKEAFAVMLMTVHNLPFSEDTKHPISNPFAVIAANDNFEGKWGWVHLTPEEKDLIGNQLMEAHIPDRWYWCSLYLEDN